LFYGIVRGAVAIIYILLGVVGVREVFVLREFLKIEGLGAFGVVIYII
jgi:hypothetical protein